MDLKTKQPGSELPSSAPPAKRKSEADSSVVPSPEQLARYAMVGPALPALVLQGRDHELTREFRYAVLSLTYGIVAFLSIVFGFLYLVMQGHAHAAAGLLATGVLGLIGGFVRSRLRNEQAPR